MKRIETIGSMTEEWYQNRDDRVTYRSITFLPESEYSKTQLEKLNHTYPDHNLGCRVVITKMV